MQIINQSEVTITVNGNAVKPTEECSAVEMWFNTQTIYSDIGSVEILSEYGKRSFKSYGQLTAYESEVLKDDNGLAKIIVNSIYQARDSMTFKERLETVEKYKEWVKEQNAKYDFNLCDNHETFLAFMEIKGLLKGKSIINDDTISRSALLASVDKEREYLLARGLTGAEHILVKNFRDLIVDAPPLYSEEPINENS